MSKVLRFYEFLFERQNKYKQAQLLLEGSAYGHITHLGNFNQKDENITK